MSEKTLDSSIGTTIRVEPPYNLQPTEPEFRYGYSSMELLSEAAREMAFWTSDILGTIKAQHTVGQVPPFRPISLFGWVP